MRSFSPRSYAVGFKQPMKVTSGLSIILFAHGQKVFNGTWKWKLRAFIMCCQSQRCRDSALQPPLVTKPEGKLENWSHSFSQLKMHGSSSWNHTSWNDDGVLICSIRTVSAFIRVTCCQTQSYRSPATLLLGIYTNETHYVPLSLLLNGW